MKPTPRTWLLLAVMLVFVGLNLLSGRTGASLDSALPTVDAAPADTITRIELSDAVRKVVLEPGAEGGWRMMAPVDAPADQQMVDDLLRVFADDIQMDVQVDQGNLDTYGLDAGNGIVVELWTGGELPSRSLTVGGPAPGGSNFVRLSGDDAIYRARVGGRDRFSTKGSEWRNRVPLGFERGEVIEVETALQGMEGWTLVRGESPGLDEAGNPRAGRWGLDPDPGWTVDHDAIEAMLSRLGALRAEEVLADDFDGGFKTPVANARFGLADGSVRTLEVGARGHPDAAFVRVDGQPEVYRVPKAPLLSLVQPADAWRDKTLMRFDVADIDTLALEEGSQTWMVRQAGGIGRWEVVQPPNVDVDVGEVARAAQVLSQLRGDAVADGVSPAAAGLVEPAARLTVYLLDGSAAVLELGAATTGPDGQPARFVRTPGRPAVMVLREASIQRLLQAFGRR